MVRPSFSKYSVSLTALHPRRNSTRACNSTTHTHTHHRFEEGRGKMSASQPSPLVLNSIKPTFVSTSLRHSFLSLSKMPWSLSSLTSSSSTSAAELRSSVAAAAETEAVGSPPPASIVNDDIALAPLSKTNFQILQFNYLLYYNKSKRERESATWRIKASQTRHMHLSHSLSPLVTDIIYKIKRKCRSAVWEVWRRFVAGGGSASAWWRRDLSIYLCIYLSIYLGDRQSHLAVKITTNNLKGVLNKYYSILWNIFALIKL